MDNKQKTYVAVGAVAIAVALLFLMRQRDSGVIANAAANDPFTVPYSTDGKLPGSGFNSVVNLTLDTDAWAGLANQYMPVFGFVGVGVTGSLPRTIQNTIINTTPPQQVVQMTTTPAAPIPQTTQPQVWRMVPPDAAVKPSRFGAF